MANFRNAGPVTLGELVGGRKVVDGRTRRDPALWAQAGWGHRGKGRPEPAPRHFLESDNR